MSHKLIGSFYTFILQYCCFAASAFGHPFLKSSIFGTGMILSKRTNAVIPGTPLLRTTDVLNAFEDEYGGVVVDPTFLPNTLNAFSASLRSSLSYWSQQVIRPPINK
jgi:hypothetical protein